MWRWRKNNTAYLLYMCLHSNEQNIAHRVLSGTHRSPPAWFASATAAIEASQQHNRQLPPKDNKQPKIRRSSIPDRGGMREQERLR